MNLGPDIRKDCGEHCAQLYTRSCTERCNVLTGCTRLVPFLGALQIVAQC